MKKRKLAIALLAMTSILFIYVVDCIAEEGLGLKARVEIIMAKDGNYELKNVEYYNENDKTWGKAKIRFELPRKLLIEEMGSVNIHAAKIQLSPGHPCIVNRREVWCP